MATYVILGGGLAGFRAAEQLRRSDDAATIVLVSEEPGLTYDRPPLSKEYLRGDWDLDRITLLKAEAVEAQRIELRAGVAATAIDAKAQTVALSDGSSLHYDGLVYATGGRVRTLNIPGADLAGVGYLRTLADADALKAAATEGKRAVVIGAGFIGVELAASLAKAGVQVTVLEVMPYIWSRFLDERLATHIQKVCEEQGVRFLTSVQPTAIIGNGRAEGVTLATGETLPADIVCIGVGIVPNVELAQAAGLTVDGGVVVDQYLQTSDPHIYAAGDVISFPDPIFKKQRRVEHWGHAEYTGVLAAANLVGPERKAYDHLSYVWSDVFDLHLEFAGEEKDYDHLLVRGSLDERSFTVLYVKGGALQAYLGVNAPPREFRVLQRLIREQTPLEGKLEGLQDRSADLRALFA